MIHIPERNIPLWRILSEAHIEKIHGATIKLMEDVGVQINHDHAIALLEKAGVKVENRVAKIPGALLESALKSAPDSITVFDREGAEAMYLKPGYSYFGCGSDVTYTIDRKTGKRVPTNLESIKDFTRLVDGLDNVDFMMSMGIAPEIDKGHADQNHFAAMVDNTTKPLLFTSQSEITMDAIVNIHSLVAGGAEQARAKPFAVLYSMVMSPLVHTPEGLQSLLKSADAGIPCIYSAAPMHGGTGPITSAGSLLISNVEMLTGLVIHQLQKEGAPFIYGAVISPIDMRTTVNPYNGPEAMQTQVGSLQLADYYHLPTFATGGSADSKVFDQQAATEASMSILTAAMAGGNLIHDIGYLESGNCSSQQAAVYCNEVISETRKILSGVEVSDESLSADVITRVGIGGNFLEDDQTLEKFKEEVWYPELFDRGNYEQWQSMGGKDLGERANQKVNQIHESHQPKALEDKVHKEMWAIAKR